MATSLDLRIPNRSTSWELWHRDTFDRGAPPALEVGGIDIVQGLYNLWLHTLNEGIQDDGTASFSSFRLTWGPTMATCAEVWVQPFDNSALAKLRRWARLPQRGEHSAEPPDRPDDEQRNALVSRLAHLHFHRLVRSSRWTAEALLPSAETQDLLARVDSMTDPSQLESDR